MFNKTDYLLLFGLLACCQEQPAKQEAKPAIAEAVVAPVNPIVPYDTTISSIHVFVALCDNEFQGIVPVPAAIGNGKDPDQNLYWGCGYGVRTYFKNSQEWKLVKTTKLDTLRLERLVFRHKTNNYYLVADAYDGEYIQQCTKDFLNSCAGQWKDSVHVNGRIIGIGGHAKLLAYIGHDGLMDFSLSDSFANTDGKQRDGIILACISKSYFAPHLQSAGAYPLVWTTGLMCPEAYTLHDAITGYVHGESRESIRARAAQAYAVHQKCSVKAAKNLLVSGW